MLIFYCEYYVVAKLVNGQILCFRLDKSALKRGKKKIIGRYANGFSYILIELSNRGCDKINVIHFIYKNIFKAMVSVIYVGIYIA